ncbi:hypothetical protein [Modestobacter marinus]|uniref:hypothetical protein n=1 Tax=Modestobacter marinus TaxID=477641 RepID=UPI001C94A268|nr:hypothetical protein [Modestobacter marinus]
MTQDAAARLHLVTGNHVVPVDVVVEQPAPEEQPRRTALLRRPVGMAAVIAGLTIVLALLARQPWQLPQRAGGGVADVPQSLTSFLVLCAVLCVWLAGRLARPASTLRTSAEVATWWAIVIGAATVSLAAALSLASHAGTGEEPEHLLVLCAVPMVPAVLTGILAGEDERAARVRLALSTGVVTVPLGVLGWALLSSTSAAGLADVLAMTAMATALPFVLAVTFVAADRRHRPAG